VNNSLLLILGSVEHVEVETEINVIAEALRTIKTATLDGAATIRRIQDLGRLKDDADFVLLDLNEIVSDAKNITRAKWEEEPKNRGLTVKVAKNLADEPMIQGNASDLRQALINLIINAVDAMPQGGEIELRTEVKLESVRLSVRDSGMGAPPEIKEKIFDPFFSTKGERVSASARSTGS
jgi:signal transduction histidine kinase